MTESIFLGWLFPTYMCIYVSYPLFGKTKIDGLEDILMHYNFCFYTQATCKSKCCIILINYPLSVHSGVVALVWVLIKVKSTISLKCIQVQQVTLWNTLATTFFMCWGEIMSFITLTKVSLYQTCVCIHIRTCTYLYIHVYTHTYKCVLYSKIKQTVWC